MAKRANLYEESFNADTYINILQEAIREMRYFTTEEKITMQMDKKEYAQFSILM